VLINQINRIKTVRVENEIIKYYFDITKYSEIEGERSNTDQVRSSVANKKTANLSTWGFNFSPNRTKPESHNGRFKENGNVTDGCIYCEFRKFNKPY
jgi:hypothetical protein